MEETGDWNEYLFLIGRVTFYLSESDVVMMVEIDDVVFLLVPCVVEEGRNIARRITTVHRLRMGDVSNVAYTAIFRHLHVVVGILEMEVVAVANI